MCSATFTLLFAVSVTFMIGNDNHGSNPKKFRPDHPDVPSLTHAILVFMLGIAVLHFSRLWTGGLITETIVKLSMVLLPLWACYMFQFNLRQTFFLQFPGWRSWIGILLGAGGMFVLLFWLEPLLWSIPYLQPSSDHLEMFRQSLNLILDREIWLIVLLIGVLTPVSEEILFRGFFLRAIRESSNIYVSVIVLGLFFGILHALLIQSILMTIFGIYLGIVVWLGRSIIPTIIIHVIHNTTVLILSGAKIRSIRPDPSHTQLPIIYQTGIIALGIGSVLLSLYLFYRDRYWEAETQERMPSNELYQLHS